MLFERWRHIFGHFFRSSLKIASYFRLIHAKTASKSASTIVSNPNGNSGLDWEKYSVQHKYPINQNGGVHSSLRFLTTQVEPQMAMKS